MRALFISRRMPDRVIDAAQRHFDVTLRDEESRPLTPDELRASLRDFDYVLPTLGDRFDAEVFADVPQPRARMLANFGVGYNHIDIAAAQMAGLIVTNTPGAVTEATADIALMLILMTARRAGEGERNLRAGRWQGWGPTQFLGVPVSGRQVGIIGMGRIGKAIARRCHAGFGMEVIFHSRSVVANPGVPARQVLMPEAMAADFVVIAVPGGVANHHLIDTQALSYMKQQGIFINIARGDVVDEAALIAAVQANRIAGAGLDVYEHEPTVPAALIGMENVTLLPHLGTAALEVREAMGMMALDNLIAARDGRDPPNRV